MRFIFIITLTIIVLAIPFLYRYHDVAQKPQVQSLRQPESFYRTQARDVENKGKALRADVQRIIAERAAAGNPVKGQY